jgi:hypothetical protein
MILQEENSNGQSLLAGAGTCAAELTMAILLHGTTRHRAEQLMTQGPDPDFIEPGGGARAEGFSTCLEFGPFPLGTPQEYACRKAVGFPNEGGPVILAVGSGRNHLVGCR